MDNEAKNIAFKGTAEALIILIPEEMSTEVLLNQVAEKVRAAGKFFRGAKLKVVYRGKVLTEGEEQQLVAAMVENGGAIIEHIRHEEAPAPVEKKKPQKLSGMPLRKIFFKDLQEGMCKFVKGTIRGVTSVFYDVNVVVLGDANPGSEIVASGNVVVLGALRGMVHAGADGNKDAVVAALKLCPTQLRIADLITRCPDTSDELRAQPELAFIKDEIIYVERVGIR